MPSGSGIRNYSNVFPATTVVGSIPASTPGTSEVYTLNSVTGLPVAPFAGAFNRGQNDEEAVLVTSVNVGTKAVTLTRGYDGTPANAHSNATQAVAFEHVVVALDWREANAHVNDSSVSHAHGPVVAADIAAGAVGPAALAGNAVGQVAVASGYVDLANDQTVNGVKTFGTGLLAAATAGLSSASYTGTDAGSTTRITYGSTLTGSGSGMTLTFIAPPSGRIMVVVHTHIWASAGGAYMDCLITDTVTSTVRHSPDDNMGVWSNSTGGTTGSAAYPVSGLTPGNSHTVVLQFRSTVSTSTASFDSFGVSVIPSVGA